MHVRAPAERPRSRDRRFRWSKRDIGASQRWSPHGRALTWYAHLLLTCSEHRESRRCALEGLALLTKDSQVNPCADRAQINAAFVLCNDALFLGELGEALRVVEAAVAALTRNGNEAFAHMLRLWRARLVSSRTISRVR